MTRPTSRVLALLELLQGGGTRRVGDLAGRLGVDERTVRRYAEHLIELDIPVRSVRGRYGGYRLAPGYRMPPLMLTDDEAVAMAIGLVVGRRAGLLPESTASESALAKLHRVLPARLADRLSALLATSSFTAPPRSATPIETGTLLTIAEAARDRLTVEITYTDRRGRRSTRTIAPDGVVGHAGHWYVATADRTFRLDRIASASLLTATTERAPGNDPVDAVLKSLAAAPWAHKISVRVQGSVDDVQRRLPLGLALVTTLDVDPAKGRGAGEGGLGKGEGEGGPGEGGPGMGKGELGEGGLGKGEGQLGKGGSGEGEAGLGEGEAGLGEGELGKGGLGEGEAGLGEGGPGEGGGGPREGRPRAGGPGEVRVEFHAERLDWVPALLAGLDRPFVIEEPPELRLRVTALANQLTTWAAG